MVNHQPIAFRPKTGMISLFKRRRSALLLLGDKSASVGELSQRLANGLGVPLYSKVDSILEDAPPECILLVDEEHHDLGLIEARLHQAGYNTSQVKVSGKNLTI